MKQICTFQFLAAAFVCALPVGACTQLGSPLPGVEPLFDDDFDGPSLESGWTFDGGDPQAATLAARLGYLRLLPGAPIAEQERAGTHLLLRDAEGDFVLTTRLEFEPAADRQGAGLFIRGTDGRTVSFGMLEAAGPRGTFHGLVIIAERAGGADPLSQFEQFDGSAVTLRLDRAGNRFTASYSIDDALYTNLPVVQTDLSRMVEVGIGNFVGDNCTARCAEGSAADFEYFQIGRNTETGGG